MGLETTTNKWEASQPNLVSSQARKTTCWSHLPFPLDQTMQQALLRANHMVNDSVPPHQKYKSAIQKPLFEDVEDENSNYQMG